MKRKYVSGCNELRSIVIRKPDNMSKKNFLNGNKFYSKPAQVPKNKVYISKFIIAIYKTNKQHNFVLAEGCMKWKLEGLRKMELQ